jgi:WD40 repeat protein
MHLCEELNSGVCATSDGGAALFSLEDGQFFVGIMLFETVARSVTIVKHDNGKVNVDMDGNKEHVSGCLVHCRGGSNGTIHRTPLNVDSDKKLDMNDPFVVTNESDTSISPRHVGPVMCLTSPGAGIFVSGGQDGALRVWKIGDID